ncbi:MAG TPA: (2Fe-2S)-binding protein [Pseudomonas sp.]|uniref:(2Fe-2S)-binding protein n=1 Tax=Pseudomonas sp. TaxID=306 RepID=UPI002EDAA96D
MRANPLFTSLDADGQQRIRIEFDGQSMSVLDNIPLASALLEAGVEHTRCTVISGAPRSAYCMMGVCFDCLVLIDDVAQQACQVRTRAGLQVSRLTIAIVEGAGND